MWRVLLKYSKALAAVNSTSLSSAINNVALIAGLYLESASAYKLFQRSCNINVCFVHVCLCAEQQRKREGNLLVWMNMGLVSSIQQFSIAIIGICKYRNQPTEQISSKEKYNGNTPTVEVFNYFFMVLHQTLYTVHNENNNVSK